MNENRNSEKEIFTERHVMIPALIVILLQYISIGRPQDIIMFLRAIRPGVIAIGLTMLAALFYWNSINGPIIFQSITVRRFRNLVILMVFLIPFSVVPQKAVHFFMYEFYKNIVFFFCFCHFIRSFREVRLSILIMILSSFTLALSMLVSGSSDGRMSIGTHYDPNDIAMLFIATLPLAFYYIYLSRGLLRLFCVLTVLTSVIALSLTQSRGAFIGGIVLILVWFFQKSGYSMGKKYGRKIIVVALLLIISSSFFPESYWDRINTIFSEGETGSGRLTIWTRGVQMMIWNPQGVGPGSFTTVYGRYLRSGEFALTEDVYRARAWETVHNSFLLVGVELGFIGLTLYILWLLGMFTTLSWMKSKIEKYRLDDTLYQHCSMVQLSIVGFIVPAFFLSQSFSFIILTLGGYVVALERIVNADFSGRSKEIIQVDTAG